VQLWLQQRSGPTWLTPHAAEFERLFPELAALPPHQAASQAAQQSQCWVLRKGARTVIASPDGMVRQVLQSEARAARAGLGDVLSGYAAGLGAMGLAAGLDPTGDHFDGLLALAALAHASAGIRQSQAGEGAANPLAIAQMIQKVQDLERFEQAESNLTRD
jgi:NAD(P)H-hydrate epimerase